MACLILLDETKKTLYFGNIGNSEVIVYKKNDTKEEGNNLLSKEPKVFLSKHRPKDIDNKKNEQNIIFNDKLYGVLNVNRGFGCFAYFDKDFSLFDNKLGDKTDISIYNLNDDDEFIFIGTESIIECIDKQQFGDLIKKKAKENGNNLTKTLNAIITNNIEYDFYNNDTEYGFDNITCILIEIKNNEKKN